MGTVDALANVRAIVERQTDDVIVVVSALGGVTNQLIAMTDAALAHETEKYRQLLAEMRNRHLDVMRQTVPPERQLQCEEVLLQFLDSGLARFFAMLDNTASELMPDFIDQVRDAIVNHGEIMSSAIVACMIDNAMPHFSPNFIKTCDRGSERILDAELTERLIREEFTSRKAHVHVVQGFIASDARRDIETNLGRGGSDFTAALIAAALNAESLEIWTDVDGFMTADPRTDPEAVVIPKMTYEQAQRMCDAGAKVIYAPTLAPVATKGIPVWVKNTFNPNATGTVIAAQQD